tara:strand:+ start:147 stop:1100 length:954 start_codon:yes stop_codon:yes gene_type:complete
MRPGPTNRPLNAKDDIAARNRVVNQMYGEDSTCSHMLVDARNVLYRAIFASKAEERRNVAQGYDNSNKYHHFTIFLRQLRRWVIEFRPSSVHLFWDAPRKDVWRMKIHSKYKDRSKSTYVEDISEDLYLTTKVAGEFFEHMNVRQFYKANQEADDLIYTATTILHPESNIIISSDSDMIQIPYSYNSCSQYDPGKKKLVELPTCDPVMQKALVGDKSDNIMGYRGIGPKKSQKLLEDRSKLQTFISTEDSHIFSRNLLLIDLSLNPKLLHNKRYVLKQLSKPVSFNKDKINSLIMEHKVNGLLQEYNDLVMPFAKLK